MDINSSISLIKSQIPCKPVDLEAPILDLHYLKSNDREKRLHANRRKFSLYGGLSAVPGVNSAVSKKRSKSIATASAGA
jgi:hypothetical protein